jgi:hypothetical protein
VHRITWDTSRGQLTSHTRLSRSLADFSKSLCSLAFSLFNRGPATPEEQVPPVWTLPLSLATTYGIIAHFLFLGLLRCFTSPRLASLDYSFIQRYSDFTRSGFSHSDIHGSLPACGSPWLIATCYVLLRLLAPRHPPFALSSLITKFNLRPFPIAFRNRSKGSGLLSDNCFCPFFLYLCVVVKELPADACAPAKNVHKKLK